MSWVASRGQRADGEGASQAEVFVETETRSEQVSVAKGRACHENNVQCETGDG